MTARTIQTPRNTFAPIHFSNGTKASTHEPALGTISPTMKIGQRMDSSSATETAVCFRDGSWPNNAVIDQPKTAWRARPSWRAR